VVGNFIRSFLLLLIKGKTLWLQHFNGGRIRATGAPSTADLGVSGNLFNFRQVTRLLRLRIILLIQSLRVTTRMMFG